KVIPTKKSTLMKITSILLSSAYGTNDNLGKLLDNERYVMRTEAITTKKIGNKNNRFLLKIAKNRLISSLTNSM
ncbi:hypothetical protein CW705_06580, partial [Candidatus Bathyarchaeota archaeon]